MKKYSIVFVGVVGLWLLLRTFVLHYLDYQEVGITNNLITGEIGLLEEAGYNILPPWVLMSRVDTKPTRVCLTSASRAVNCKLVKFEAGEYKKFIHVEGFHLYWWYNRLSVNFGYDDEYRGMKDVLRGYAFARQKYSFITELKTVSNPMFPP